MSQRSTRRILGTRSSTGRRHWRRAGRSKCWQSHWRRSNWPPQRERDMQILEATADQLSQAEAYILPAFQKSLEDLLRERKDPKPQFSDDRAIFGLADKAVRDYPAATARSSTLPQLSQVQLWEIRQRLYIQHSALGPLGELLAKEGVEDIHMNGLDHAYLEYGDHREPLPPLFESEDELISVVRFYAEQSGRRFDVSSPMVTVTMRDGSRLNAVLPPIAKPLVVTIRKQQLRRFLSLADLVRSGTIPSRAVPLLEAAVTARLNIILSGPTGTGKTTLARVLALMIPEDERTCVLETETELWLHELRPQFFSLEERDANVEGAGRITMQDLFQRAALRQRPKRIIVGEVRGTEALDMMLAMSADRNLAPHVVRRLIGAGVDLIVHLSTYHRGDQELRRLGSLAFVAENRENDLGSPVVSGLASYRILDDSWDWRREALVHMPDKVWKKLLAAGVNPEDVVREVLGNGES